MNEHYGSLIHMYTNKTNNSSSTPIPYSNLCNLFFITWWMVLIKVNQWWWTKSKYSHYVHYKFLTLKMMFNTIQIYFLLFSLNHKHTCNIYITADRILFQTRQSSLTFLPYSYWKLKRNSILDKNRNSKFNSVLDR